MCSELSSTLWSVCALAAVCDDPESPSAKMGSGDVDVLGCGGDVEVLPRVHMYVDLGGGLGGGVRQSSGLGSGLGQLVECLLLCTIF